MGMVSVSNDVRKALFAVGVGLFIAGPAHAVCPATNRFNFTFATAPAATLNYASTYSYTATNGLGQSQAIGVSFISNGTNSTIVGGQQMPAISTLVNDGGTTNRNLVIGAIFSGRTANVAVNTRIVSAVFTFPTPIRDFTVQVNDVDFVTNQFRDWLMVTGTNGALSYVPSLTTPFGQSNATGGTRTSASSSQALGATTTPVTITSSQSVGTGASGNSANTGTITASFAQPVTRIEVRYGNYPLQAGETATGQQAIGIQAISFCPMPQLTFTKSSTPFITAANDPRRFNTPNSDVIYSLTLTNANTSPIDLNQVVLTDPLPTQLSFLNGDIDDAGPLTTNYEFVPGTSGLTFATGNLSYSNNGGASYAYTPATGYDPLVTAIRLNPQGVMAANSSFTLRFRARIK
ncbi:MAG: hypothetical protein AABY88_11555 [Pseudomonadota bacterium]